MDKTHSLQALLNNTATEEDIALLKRLLASGEISIGGNVNQSVIIIGSGNKVELPPAALDRLNARPMLGNLDRDLTGEEIASGLRRLDKLLPNRAPVLLPHYKEQVGRLRPTLKTEIKSLGETSRRERVEALAAINSICVEALDVSFNGLSLGEEAPKYDARSPFRGLESFRPEDSEFFFGREVLTQKLVGKIKAHSFLAVLGASGSGKSSLVMAGVIPALASDYVIFRPGTNPLDELESVHGKSLIVVDQFEELFTLTRDESTRKDFIARLLDESARARIILTLRSDFLGEVGAYRTLSAEIQNHLEIIPPMDMDELRRAMEGQAGAVGLRFEADLSQQILDDVAGEPGAMPLLQHALWELWNRRHGRNLRASEYRAFGGVKQAITSTAEKVYTDCSKLEQDQLRDIFLRITRLDDSDEGRDTRRRVPLGDLIPSGSDAASITLLLDKLANARLIVKTVNDDKTEIEVAHEALIRHWERLRIWLNEDRDNLSLRESVSKSAKEWTQAGRDETLLNHRGGRLDDALTLGDDSRYWLTDVEQAYLRECAAYQKQEQIRRDRLRRQITTGLEVGFILVLIVAVFATLQWQRAEKQTEIAFARQLASQSSVELSNGTDHNALIGGLLAAESLKIYPSYNGIQSANEIIKTFPRLLFTVNDDTYDQFVYYGASLSFDKNAKRIALGDPKSGDIRIWDIHTKKLVAQMKHNDVEWVRFSPDDKFLASSSREHVYVWDPISGSRIAEITPCAVDVNFAGGKTDVVINWDNFNIKCSIDVPSSVSVGSEDYSYVATNLNGTLVVYSNFNNVVVWDLTKDKVVNVFPFHRKNYEYARYAAFSAKNNRLAIVTSWATVYVFDIKSGKEVFFAPNDLYVSPALAISTNGRFLAYTTEEDISYIWNLDQDYKVAQIVQGTSILELTFSSDEHFIASRSNDGITEVWELDNVLEFVDTSNKDFESYETSDEKWMVTKKDDEIVILAPLSTTQDLEPVELGKDVASLVFPWNSRWIIEEKSNGDIIIFNAQTLDNIASLYLVDDYDLAPYYKNTYPNLSLVVDDDSFVVQDKHSQKYLWQQSFDKHLLVVYLSPNEKYVIAGGQDKMSRVWDINSGEELLRTNYQSDLIAASFSDDSMWAISSDGGYPTIKTWDLSILFLKYVLV